MRYIVLTLSLLFCTATNAAIVTVNFTATLTSAFVIGSYVDITDLSLGDPISGFFSYDDEVAFSSVSFGGNATSLTYDRAISEFFLDLGISSGYISTLNAENNYIDVTVGNNIPNARDSFRALINDDTNKTNLFFDGLPFAGLAVSGTDNTATVIENIAALPSSLSLEDFVSSNNNLTISFRGQTEDLFLRATLDCLETSSPCVSSVPLPAAVWLFGSALLGLGAAIRRRA